MTYVIWELFAIAKSETLILQAIRYRSINNGGKLECEAHGLLHLVAERFHRLAKCISLPATSADGMLDQLLLKCDFRQIAVITCRFEFFDVRGAFKICPVFIKLFSTLLEAHEVSGQHAFHDRRSDVEEHPHARIKMLKLFVDLGDSAYIENVELLVQLRRTCTKSTESFESCLMLRLDARHGHMGIYSTLDARLESCLMLRLDARLM